MKTKISKIVWNLGLDWTDSLAEFRGCGNESFEFLHSKIFLDRLINYKLTFYGKFCNMKFVNQYQNFTLIRDAYFATSIDGHKSLENY
jgi:hypothetical protein